MPTPTSTVPLSTAQTQEKALTHRTLGEGNGTPTPLLLPGKSHGRRSLVGFSPWGRKESYRTERLHFHFPVSLLLILLTVLASHPFRSELYSVGYELLVTHKVNLASYNSFIME